MKLRVIILAAGSGSRWDDYRGVPKHLIEIEGEILLKRTVRQFLKYTSDVWVVGLDERYRVDNANLFIPDVEENPKEMHKFISSHELWLEEEDSKTILVFADVYFTDEAVETIVSDKDKWKFFLRSKGSEITGKPHKEIFAISFNYDMTVIFSHQIFMLYVKANQIENAGGWYLFRTMTNQNPHYRGNLFGNNKYVEIDDWTEDFDYPQDLRNWEERRAQRL
jgi:hypothetical protein